MVLKVKTSHYEIKHRTSEVHQCLIVGIGKECKNCAKQARLKQYLFQKIMLSTIGSTLSQQKIYSKSLMSIRSYAVKLLKNTVQDFCLPASWTVDLPIVKLISTRHMGPNFIHNEAITV